MKRQGRAERQRRALERLRHQAGVTLSHHAQHRARELGFHESEVLLCVISPEQTYGCGPRYPSERRTYQRIDCACIVDTTLGVVVTVLLRHNKSWQHGIHTRSFAPRTHGSTADEKDATGRDVDHGWDVFLGEGWPESCSTLTARTSEALRTSAWRGPAGSRSPSVSSARGAL